MLGKFSLEYLAMDLRKSPSSKSSGDFYLELNGTFWCHSEMIHSRSGR